MKTIYTHVNPHLDDVCAIWLLQRFTAEWQSARVKFLSARMKPHESSRNAVYIGIGRGKYDEHKGDIGETATTLVWKDVMPRVKDTLTRRGLELMVAWVRKEDLGLGMGEPSRPYSAVTAVQHQWSLPGGDQKHLDVSFAILDALLDHFRNRAVLERDWKNRIEFKTPWGRGVGIITYGQDTSSFIYEQGFVLCVRTDKKYGYRGISGKAGTRVDLTKAAARLKKIDPHAEWFLHHSKKLLLSGSRVAPGMRVSKLPLGELINVVRSK